MNGGSAATQPMTALILDYAPTVILEPLSLHLLSNSHHTTSGRSRIPTHQTGAFRFRPSTGTVPSQRMANALMALVILPDLEGVLSCFLGCWLL
jgi:hypothetical protein